MSIIIDVFGTRINSKNGRAIAHYGANGDTELLTLEEEKWLKEENSLEERSDD